MSNIRTLIDKLNYYRNAYYNNNESLISDKEYDELFDQLAEMEANTGIIYPDSPTQTVGYEVVSKLKKVRHNHQLLSLAKTTDINEFADYFGSHQATIMAKMDGLTCSITYRGGKLVLAESRGNGEVGEDITHNVRMIKNLPQTIPFKGKFVVDGECIIDELTFQKINEPLIRKAEREAKGKGLNTVETEEYIRKHSYANPRNLAAGSVRQLDSEIAAEREIRFVAWKLYCAEYADGISSDVPKSFSTAFPVLESYGFEVAPYVQVEDWNFSEAIESVTNICKSKGYPIDGCVGAFTDIEYGNSLGSTGHHPKHSLAFKFYQADNETILRDIEWNTSRTGAVNPVAIFDPVEIDGTIVTRASLSNVSIIKELELGIGDTITVIKANQIIPKITDNITRSNTYQIPCKCPSCGMDLSSGNDTDGRIVLFCDNPYCDSIIIDTLTHFASREGMNIDGLSEKKIGKLLNFLLDFADIYRLEKYKDRIKIMDGFGISSVQKLLAAIENSKTCSLSNVLYAIGLPGIGKETAKDIAKHCISMDTESEPNHLRRFLNLSKSGYDWSQIDGIGIPTSDAVNRYVSEKYDELCELIPYLVIADRPEIRKNELFAGKTFCITGKLNRYSNRDMLTEDIEMYGGKVVSGVTAKTDYLITNDPRSGSGKNAKAIQYGTTIITEDDFIRMCEEKK